jgi:hypothetical protein
VQNFSSLGAIAAEKKGDLRLDDITISEEHGIIRVKQSFYENIISKIVKIVKIVNRTKNRKNRK